MDAITHLFTHFPFRTHVFFKGLLCRTGQFDEPNKGYLHLIERGRCMVNHNQHTPLMIEEPCVLFSPSGCLHSIQPLSDDLSVLCIDFDFGEQVCNPLIDGLNRIIPLYLNQDEHLNHITQSIFQEHQATRCGFQAAMQHLSAYLMIQVLRFCLQNNLLQIGLLRGLTDSRLAPLLINIHQHPEWDWHVDTMAEQACMSRAKFVPYFKEMMKVSPMEYVANWRIQVAQMWLRRGLSVALTAEKVGYSHNAALTRVFVRKLGQTPKEWLQTWQMMSLI